MQVGIISNSAMFYMPLLTLLHQYQGKAGAMLYVAQSAEGTSRHQETAAVCNAAGFSFYAQQQPDDIYNWYQMNQPDIVFVAGYGSKINLDRLGKVKHGIFNVHFGPLPQFRGPMPVFWQLKKDVEQIGLVIHRMTEKFDAGRVVWQLALQNQAHFNYDNVHQLFADLQGRGVVEILDKIKKGLAIEEVQQQEAHSAYYKRAELKDIVINWNSMNPQEIIALIKACSWNGGAMTAFGTTEIKIIDATPGKRDGTDRQPGTVILGNDGSFSVICADRQLIDIHFFKLNNANYVPSRFAAAYGLATGQCLLSL